MKKVPTGNKGLGKLPTGVRNKMGYMKKGGTLEEVKGYKKGGVVKKKKKAKALTKSQVATLKKHSVHHSAKHMAEMRKAMKAGSSFTASHKIAKKKIGK